MREAISRRFAAFSSTQRALLGTSAFFLMLVLIFVAVVLPLLRNDGPLAAELAGQIPTTARTGRELTVDIAIDNTGDRLISPICLGIAASHAEVQQVVFQGTDQVTPSNGRACGGRLTAQETISVRLIVVPRGGNIDLALSPLQGGATIGPILHGSIRVTG
ncbi:MAG: hypothetical protein ACR2GX_05000 [Candidatus Dormibacteria bacterium]